MAVFVVMAQNEQPIKWRMTVKMTSKNEGTVTLRAIIENGWHLYGTELPDDGPIATSFNFEKSKGISFVQHEFTPSCQPETHKDPNFGIDLQWWPVNVTFTRNFVITGDLSDALIDGSVRFMGCNDQTCLPPSSVNFKTTPKPYNPEK